MPEKFFALLAAIGNSRAARSARAKLQFRDRAGRFAEMGRGLKFKIRRANGRVVSLNGVFIGTAETAEFGQVYVKDDPSGLPDGFYQVSSSNALEILATLSPEMLKARGIVVGQDAAGNALGSRLAEEIQNESEIVRLDAPLGWARDENVSNRFVTGDGELEIVEMDDNRFMVNRLDNDEPAQEAFSWADALRVADRLDAEVDGVSLPDGQRDGQPVEPVNEDGSQEYPNLLERVRARGRLSLDTVTGNLVNEGYLVGVDGFEKKISAAEFYSPQGLEALAEYVEDNRVELGGDGGKRLSVWHDRDSGLVSFDVVQQVADLGEATRLGRDGGQSVIRDMANDRDVSLGGTSSEGGDNERQVDGAPGSGESAGDVEGGDSPVVDSDARESGKGGDGEPEPELDGLGQPIPSDRAGLEQRVGFLDRQLDRFNPERPGPDLEDIEATRDDIQARLDNFDAPADAAPEPVEAPVGTDTPEATPEPVAEIPEAPAVEPSVTPAADLSDDELKAEISDAVGPSDETPNVEAPEPNAEDVSEPSATPVADLSDEELAAEIRNTAPDEAPAAAGWAVNPLVPTLAELESAPEGSRVKRTHKQSFDEMSFQKVGNEWFRVMQDGSISPVIIYPSKDFDSPRNFYVEVQASAPAAPEAEANVPSTNEVMDAQPQFTPEPPDFDAEQAPAAVTVRQREAISAIRPYDADGNLERRILEGATSEEILELLEVNLQWNANQMEAMAGRFEDMPRAAEKARRDGYEREQKAIVDLDKPDPVPFASAPIVSPEVDQEAVNAQIALAREAKIAADKVRNDFLDSLVPGRVLTREDLAMLPMGSIVESLSGPSGVRHGLDISRAQKDLRGTFIQVGRFIPEDGLSSIDAARQLFQFSPERRMENGEEITLVSVPATLARPAGVVPAPEPQVVNTGLGRESLPNNTRVSPEGSDKVLTKTGPNSFVDEDNTPVSVPADVSLVVVPDAPASEDSGDGDRLPAIPSAPGAALTIGETKIGIMLSAARGRLDSEDFAVIEERLQRPMALEAFDNFMSWLGLQPQRPNKRTEPRNTDIPALPGNKDLQARKLAPADEEDLNLVIEDILANFPNNRRLANGDIVIASREVNGRKFDVVVRRTPDERFFVYRRVVMPDGSIVAAKVYGEAHSYKALTGKMGSALQWLFARDPYRAITRMKNREALGGEDAKFQADADSDAVTNAVSASELRNAVRDMVEHLAKEARNGRNVIDILKKSFPDGVGARAAKRGLIDSQLEAARAMPGDGGPTHISYGGGESLKPGDTVQWTDWRTNSPTYGQVFEGFVRRLKDTEQVLMPNGEYKYTDYVEAVFPEYNRLKNDPKPESRGRPFVASNLRLAAPGEPLDAFFAKREEIQENQRLVAQAGDFNLPDPNAPAPQPRAPAAPKRPLIRKVAPSGLLESPDVAPEAQGLVPQTRFDFVAEVANADAFKVRAADVAVGDVTVVQNDSNLDVYAKITKKTIVDGNLELEMIIDDFDDYKIKTYVLPLMFPMTFDVFRAKPLAAEDTEKQAIRRLVMAKGPDNSVLSDADLESVLEELNTDRAKELISALLSLPEWVPDEAMQVEDILRALGAKDTDRANVVAAMQNLGVDPGTTIARPLTTQQLRVKAIADRFQVLKTLSIQNVRVGDIVSSPAGGSFQVIEVSRRSDRPGQLKTVSVNVDTLEPVTAYFKTEASGLDRAPAVFNVKRIKDNFADWYGLETPTRINALNFDEPDPDETDAEWFGGYAEKAQALEAALNEGWDVKANINRGAQNGGVQFVKPAADYSDPEFPDPEVGAVFVKYAADKDTRDAEYLGGAMLAAMGMEGLTVGLRDDESIVVMNRINGVAPREWIRANGMLGAEDAELLDELVSSGFSKNVRAIGLFDLLAGNGDRHRGNWMIKEDGQPVAIDNGLANNAGMGIVSLSPFGKIAFPMVRGNLVKDKALYTEAELIGVRQRLAALEDTFAAMNRSDWYRGIMRNMESMIGRYL